VNNLKFAVYLAVALYPSLILHEYAHAFAADRLGDKTPRRWGRLSLNPKPLIDPFGSLILPGLVLILVASGQAFQLPLFAYAKPMPLDPYALRNQKRGAIWVTLAGLGANLALAAIAAVVLRVGVSGETALFAYAWLLVNVYMFVFQLMPVPGLDGAKLLAPLLPPHPREIYRNLDQYLVLFMLVIFFLLAGPLLGIVKALAGTVCSLLTGADVC
jgi:Zn-dependent protease